MNFVGAVPNIFDEVGLERPCTYSSGIEARRFETSQNYGGVP